ncbi:uncharacterized protein LOC112595701 [Melanaphis sacchari]|uniref:uncharacterized protein LOC112595701 n=1 Tax=Melanaphis sacchari TaxID=742174 RepID=UPI000DC14370|nr:uncharacterized protein LOC112595701 [Melanaphis sacchari]
MRAIEQQFINENLIMRQSHSVRDVREKLKQQYTPKNQCGFTMKILKCDCIPNNLECVNPRKVISLACLDNILDESLCENVSFLEKYFSKTPLMCINASRLIYTTRAFVFRNRIDWDNVIESLNFYLKVDSGYLETDRRSDRQPNLEFSMLLHCLRSSGYIEYIFELARHLKYHVELVLSANLNLVYVYKYTEEQITYGILTAFYHETECDIQS